MNTIINKWKKEIKKILCKKHGIALSTKEKAQILMDNLRIPAKRKIKKCYACKKYYVKTKYITKYN